MQIPDRKTRKLLTVYGEKHKEAVTNVLYVKRDKGARFIIGVEEHVYMEQNSLQDYIQSNLFLGLNNLRSSSKYMSMFVHYYIFFWYEIHISTRYNSDPL